MLPRRKLILDTSVCIDLANPEKVSPRDRQAITRHIRRRYRYCVSWVTWKELLVKLKRGDPQYWKKNLEPLRVLRLRGNVEYLDKPPCYAAQKLLGVGRDPCTDRWGRQIPRQPQVMSDVLDAIVRGADREALLRGDGWRYRFDLDDLDSFEDGTRTELASQLQGVRDGTFDPANSRIMAELLLRDLDIVPTQDSVDKFVSGLDASHRYDICLCSLAKNPNYDFFKKRNLSNWDDSQQLMYLCDPSMNLLVLDRDFLMRTKGSPQASRIITLEEVLRSCREHRSGVLQ